MGLNEERKKALLKRLIEKNEGKRKFPGKKVKGSKYKKKESVS